MDKLKKANYTRSNELRAKPYIMKRNDCTETNMYEEWRARYF
jgi:hypothetical protein